jgi:biopolymer transport protein ExbB
MMYHGGFIFWVLVVMGVLALLAFLERLLYLRRAQIDYSDFLKGVCNVLEKSNMEEAMTLCEETPGPAASVILTAIRHHGSAHEALTEAVANTERAELSRMERRLAAIALACQIAPLLGLLGTFFGMVAIIRAFNDQAPIIQSTDLTAGLLQAFSATIAGLLVSIECHILYSILMVRIERITLDMEACASEIIAYLTQQDRSML